MTRTNIIQLNQASNKIKWVNYAFIFFIFALNFLARPELKWAYLLYVIFIVISVFIFDFSTIINLIISLSFIEGQGRILWGYQPWARIIFDIIIVIATLKNFIAKKEFKIRGLIPPIMLIFIVFHFLWFIVEFFNFNAINLLATIASTKMYVFPFFLLIYLRQNSQFLSHENLESIANNILILLLLESTLCFYQLQGIEDFMLKISPHYFKAMKGDIFTLDKFRPFGTTHLPGAVSVYIFLTIGILFLKKKSSALYKMILSMALPLIFGTLIISQVRSASIKFFLILFGAAASIFLGSSNKPRALIKIFFSFLIFVPILAYTYPKVSHFVEKFVDFESGLKRWQGFESLEDITSQRSSLTFAFQKISDQLDKYPFGLGPGMTGAATSLSIDKIKADPQFSIHTYWGFENLFISLVIEFGYGAIFYILYFLSVPFILSYYCLKCYKSNNFYETKIISISLITITTIILGNWGAIGLIYNPESFYFWFVTALGFSMYERSKIKHDDEIITNVS